MGYKIYYEDINESYYHDLNKIGEWEQQLESISKHFQSIVDMSQFTGQTATNMKNYIYEVHLVLLQSIFEMLSEYKARMLLYKDGYCSEVDEHLESLVTENHLSELEVFFSHSQSQFDEQVAQLSNALSTVYDIMDVYEPSPNQLWNDYQQVKHDIADLRMTTGYYDTNHAKGDLENLKALLASIKNSIASWMNQSTVSPSSYQQGTMASFSGREALFDTLQKVSTDRQALTPQLEEALAHEQARALEKEMAEERMKKGVVDGLVALGSVVVGTRAIVTTAGAATPLVAAAWVAGGSSILYRASNMVEAREDIYYGAQGIQRRLLGIQ